MALILPKRGSEILLRDVRPEDAVPFADMEYDIDVKKYVGGPPKKDRADWIRAFSPSVIAGCAVEALAAHVFAGHAAVEHTEDTHIPGQAEIRIVIAREFWGRHFGREALQLLIPAAFEEMRIDSLRATIHPENCASITLFESLGFQYRRKKDGDSAHWQYGHLIYELAS